MVPWEQDRIIQNDRTQTVSPRHFGIAECWKVAVDPHQFAIVGVTGNIRIAKGYVDCILGDGGCVYGEVGFLVGVLVHAESEVMPPKLLAVLPIKAEGQK